jgi:N6-L-threonylcarbamoyladenine synthase
MKPIKKILAIETSCDETAAAVIDSSSLFPHLGGGLLEAAPKGTLRVEVGSGCPLILSSIISSQIDLHKLTGGVVPEVAARAHLEAIGPVIKEAIVSSGLGTLDSGLFDKIDAIAVTNGPGLIGALLVGFNTAKTLAYALNIPLIPVNHIEGHIYSALDRVNPKQILNSKFHIPNSNFPLLALTVSGGHTSLTLMRDHGVYETIGETVDDAAGEAFDKVAKLLGLGYPGGPIVSKLAKKAGRSDFNFPRPMINSKDFNFSFSGLKTAVLHKVRELESYPSNEVRSKEFSPKARTITDNCKAELCYAFEEAVVDVLCSKALKAAEEYQPKGILLAGGVSANSRLQAELKARIDTFNEKAAEADRINFYTPSPDMTGDNAAMIGIAAFYKIMCHPELVSGSSWDKVSVDSNLRL